ncbi:MAG: hypothetical protein V4665_02595 [Patescibacteria group bacterium]
MPNQNIILIGKATEYLDEDFNLLKPEAFKYLLFKRTEESPLQMMLMIKDEPYQLHAQALFFYMQEKGLSEVIIHGGGVIKLLNNCNNIIFSGTSYAFKSVSKEELEAFIRGIWPDAEISMKMIAPLENDDKAFHRLYLLSEVLKEAYKN